MNDSTKAPGKAAKRTAVAVLGILTMATLAAAFVASYPALVGAGSAVGLPDHAAVAFGLTPDVATTVALFGGVVLRHDKVARRISLLSLVVFGLGSLALNASAALGVTPHGLVEHRVDGLPIALSLTIAALPAAGVVLSADQVVRVVAALWPAVETSLTVAPRRTAAVAASSDSTTRQATVSARVSEGKRPPNRTDEELLDAARRIASDWTRDGKTVTASGLIPVLRVSHSRAARLRDALKAEGLA